MYAIVQKKKKQQRKKKIFAVFYQNARKAPTS